MIYVMSQEVGSEKWECAATCPDIKNAMRYATRIKSNTLEVKLDDLKPCFVQDSEVAE